MNFVHSKKWRCLNREQVTNSKGQHLCLLSTSAWGNSQPTFYLRHLLHDSPSIAYLPSSQVYLLHPGHLRSVWSLCNRVIQNCCAVLPAKAIHSEWLVQLTEAQLLVFLCDCTGETTSSAFVVQTDLFNAATVYKLWWHQSCFIVLCARTSRFSSISFM